MPTAYAPIKKRGFAKVAGHVIITFTGYEADPREIYEVPEIRSYFSKLDSQVAELPALLAYLPELAFNGPGLYLMLLGDVDQAIPHPEWGGYDVHVADGERISQQALRRIRQAAAKYNLGRNETHRLLSTFMAGATHRLSWPS